MNEEPVYFESKTEVKPKQKSAKKFFIHKFCTDEVSKNHSDLSEDLSEVKFEDLSGSMSNCMNLDNMDQEMQFLKQKRENSEDHSIHASKNSQSSRSQFNTGRWSDEEHKLFLEAILLYGNEWKKVQKYIHTRSSTQARSHAQKFFLRLKKKIKTEELSDHSSKTKEGMPSQGDNHKYDSIIKYFTELAKGDGEEVTEESEITKEQRRKLISTLLKIGAPSDSAEKDLTNIKKRKKKKFVRNMNQEGKKLKNDNDSDMQICRQAKNSLSHLTYSNTKERLFYITKIKKKSNIDLNSMNLNSNSNDPKNNQVVTGINSYNIPISSHLTNKSHLGLNQTVCKIEKNDILSVNLSINNDLFSASINSVLNNAFTFSPNSYYSQSSTNVATFTENLSSNSNPGIIKKNNNNMYDELKDFFKDKIEKTPIQTRKNSTNYVQSKGVDNSKNACVFKTNENIFSDKKTEIKCIAKEENINPFWINFDTESLENFKNKSEPSVLFDDEYMKVEYENMSI